MLSRIGWLALVAVLSGSVQAEFYLAPLGSADWRTERSAVSCRLRQQVPRYGEAVFETVAGGRQSFIMRAKQNPMVGGPARLVAKPPAWNPTRETMELGAIDIGEGSEALRLDDEPASRLLESLDSGLVPEFSRPLQRDSRVLARLGLSPIDFRPAYREYRDCVGKLLPVSFEQVEHTVLEFDSAKTALSAQAQKKIDALLRYARADRSVIGFDIRAVSADTQRRLENLELAKQRAQQVNEYLLSRGIDAKSISSDYSGERGGQRRLVTIRIKRSAQP